MSRFFSSPSVLFGVVALALLLFCPARAFAVVDITLEWNPNSESDLDGYRIFVRAEGESYNYAQPDWEGTATTCTIYGLDDATNYYFVARAFDTSNNESGNSIEVPYEAVLNVPPTADAGPERTVSEGAAVTLDGSNSSDEDGSIDSYAWVQTVGTSVGLSNPSSSTPWFSAPFVGAGGEALTFELTVTDDGGLSATDTVIINVSNLNQAPTADAGPDRSVGEGATVTLDGSELLGCGRDRCRLRLGPDGGGRSIAHQCHLRATGLHGTGCRTERCGPDLPVDRDGQRRSAGHRFLYRERLLGESCTHGGCRD